MEGYGLDKEININEKSKVEDKYTDTNIKIIMFVLTFGDTITKIINNITSDTNIQSSIKEVIVQYMYMDNNYPTSFILQYIKYLCRSNIKELENLDIDNIYFKEYHSK